ncbi:hypothetical protein Tco_0065170 [Tanacetum coccineum]
MSHDTGYPRSSPNQTPSHSGYRYQIIEDTPPSQPSNKVESVSTRVSRWITTGYNRSSAWEKGNLGAITFKGGPPDHMRASEKELVVLKFPLEQKSMFRRQERMLRRQEKQRLAKDAKIQRRI